MTLEKINSLSFLWGFFWHKCVFVGEKFQMLIEVEERILQYFHIHNKLNILGSLKDEWIRSMLVLHNQLNQ